jgi:hypothetical protein
MGPFINGCIDYGFNASYANRDQQFPHESDIWPERFRSKVRNMVILRSTEIERQQCDIFSKAHTLLSIDVRRIWPVQTLNFIHIGEGAHLPTHIPVSVN